MNYLVVLCVDKTAKAAFVSCHAVGAAKSRGIPGSVETVIVPLLICSVTNSLIRVRASTLILIQLLVSGQIDTSTATVLSEPDVPGFFTAPQRGKK